jgi:hypothetical protein
MIKTPFLRAAFTVSFKAGAISPTRRDADLHQWSSHMSQMISAVFSGFHVTCSVFAPAASLSSERRLSLRSSAQVEVAMPISTAARGIVCKAFIRAGYQPVDRDSRIMPAVPRIVHLS